MLLGLSLLACAHGLLHSGNAIRGWDEADLGSIARNYTEHGYRFAYPQIDWGGDGPGFVEMQFPLVPYATALLYGLFGFHEPLAVIIPYLSGVGSVLALYSLGRRILNPTIGFLAGAFLTLSPYWAWQTTVFLNDPVMLFMATIGLLFFVRWIEEGKSRLYWVAMGAIALALLLKLSALYLGIPLLFLWAKKDGWRMLGSPRAWLFAGGTLLPSVFWYWHAHTLWLTYGNTYGILAGGFSKFSTVDLLLSGEFYETVVGRMVRFGLTPLVSCFCVLGFFQPMRYAGFLRVWLAAAVLLIVSAGWGSFSGVQYLLPALAPGALLAAGALFAAVRKARMICCHGVQRRWCNTTITVIVGTALATNTLWAMRILPHLGAGEEELVRLGEKVRQVTPEGMLIIVATKHELEDRVEGPAELDTPSQMFYYSGRKGWYSSFRWLTADFVERCRAKGARSLVVPLDARLFEEQQPLYGYLAGRYRTVFADSANLIFDLRGMH